jgi:hypothetical protein
VYLSSRALFSPAECAAVVAEAEAAAAAAEGGWSTVRHYSVPTTDQPVHTLPHTLQWFKAALRTLLAPMLAAQFPRTVAAAHRVCEANHSPSLRLPFAFPFWIVLDPCMDHAQYSRVGGHAHTPGQAARLTRLDRWLLEFEWHGSSARAAERRMHHVRRCECTTRLW